MSDVRETERRARDQIRSAQGLRFERITSVDDEPALHGYTTPEERLAAMAHLSRRAVFQIEHGPARQSP